MRVIVAGLDMDFLGQPFGPVPELLAKAEYVKKGACNLRKLSVDNWPIFLIEQIRTMNRLSLGASRQLRTDFVDPVLTIP